MIYSERNSSVTVIQLLAEGGPTHLATGFFITSGGRVFLATCHHVVSWAGGYPPAVILKLRPRGGGPLRDFRLVLRDGAGRRRWRTFLRPEDFWDVVLVELDPEDLLPFDIRPWREDECLPAGESLDPGAEVAVLTYPETYGPEPAPYDARARVCAEEQQTAPGDLSVFITRPLYHGASGSPVYRIMAGYGGDGAAGAEAGIQLVGVFTGAWPKDKPLVGHFHYAETVGRIMADTEDCMDERGDGFK
jgi:hypothetical protein